MSLTTPHTKSSRAKCGEDSKVEDMTPREKGKKKNTQNILQTEWTLARSWGRMTEDDRLIMTRDQTGLRKVAVIFVSKS